MKNATHAGLSPSNLHCGSFDADLRRQLPSRQDERCTYLGPSHRCADAASSRTWCVECEDATGLLWIKGVAADDGEGTRAKHLVPDATGVRPRRCGRGFRVNSLIESVSSVTA